MLWRPARLASFAYDAGLRGDDLATAVALALRVSGGDDAYVWRVDPGPMIDQRGLWGVDVVRFPAYAADDLSRPTVAARVMAALFGGSDGPWAWSPVDPADISPDMLAAAQTAAQRPSRTQAPAAAVTERALAGSYGGALRAADALRDSITPTTIERLTR